MIVTANPGFAPVSDRGIDGFSFEYDGKYYANINGFFNENYAHLPYYRDQGYTEYYHEGVDFHGIIGTKIVAMIYAKVLAYGTFGTYGNTLILANTHEEGIYLLGHLDDKRSDLRENDYVEPHDVIAYVGNTGGSSTGPHLHLSYYHFKYDENRKFVEKDSQSNLSWVNWTPRTYLTDPFTHKGERKEHKKG